MTEERGIAEKTEKRIFWLIDLFCKAKIKAEEDRKKEEKKKTEEEKLGDEVKKEKEHNNNKIEKVLGEGITERDFERTAMFLPSQTVLGVFRGFPTAIRRKGNLEEKDTGEMAANCLIISNKKVLSWNPATRIHENIGLQTVYSVEIVYDTYNVMLIIDAEGTKAKLRFLNEKEIDIAFNLVQEKIIGPKIQRKEGKRRPEKKVELGYSVIKDESEDINSQEVLKNTDTKKQEDCKAVVAPKKCSSLQGCFIAFCVIAFFIIGLILNRPLDNSYSGSTSTPAAKKNGGISLQKYNRLREGMTYEQVVEILEVSASRCIETPKDMIRNNGSLVQYDWGPEECPCLIVTFLNGRLVVKAQYQLEYE